MLYHKKVLSTNLKSSTVDSMVSAITVPGFPLSLRGDSNYTNLKSSTVDSMVSTVTLPCFTLSLRGDGNYTNLKSSTVDSMVSAVIILTWRAVQWTLWYPPLLY